MTTTTKTFWCSTECRTFRSSSERMRSLRQMVGDNDLVLKLHVFHVRLDRAARARDGRCQGCGSWKREVARSLVAEAVRS